MRDAWGGRSGPLSLMFPDFGIPHLILMPLSELNHTRTERGRDDQFQEGADSPLLQSF